MERKKSRGIVCEEDIERERVAGRSKALKYRERDKERSGK